jgi:hypothetical protein
MKANEHINLVAILHVAWSVLLMLASGLVFVVLGTGGLFAQQDEAAYIAIAVAMFISTMLVIVGLAGIVGAYGLFKRQRWARFTIMVLSAIWLIKIPIGTALGIYSFYALTREEVVALFEGAGEATDPASPA